ncbi:hypothetical protein [Streptomyces sp. CC228A]|uniref:hypothetical protein n=1 Tax=Streptomyces sp. CC228A TaxID=2898186 RepID=UPI001F45D602|nr:hypothetical protein [Streptomyces sp. CC228A]
MQGTAHAHGAHCVDPYAETGTAAACAGRDRALGALLEKSQATLFHHTVPWLPHPTGDGRDDLGARRRRPVRALTARRARAGPPRTGRSAWCGR